MQYEKRDEAYNQIPKDAVWSCSFGYPGEGGFTEYWRTSTGELWKITNGPYHLLPCEFDWHSQRVETS